MAECVLNKLFDVLSETAPELEKELKLTTGVEKSTPVLDAVPGYEKGQRNMTVAVIGSRETPPEILKKMTPTAKMLVNRGYKLHSGGAIGADMAFEGKSYPEVLTAGNKDVVNNKGKLVLKAGQSVKIGTKTYTDAYYVFSNKKQNQGQITGSEWVKNVATPNTRSFDSFTIGNQLSSNNEEQIKLADKARAIAKELHPYWNNMNAFQQNLMARNNYQVFGAKLDEPVDFVLFYAKESNDPLRPKGGTGQAVEAARRKGIPTINMADTDWRKQLTAAIKKGKTSTETSSTNIYYGTGENAELSNLAVRPFTYKGSEYQSVEHAYQTLKSGEFDNATYKANWKNGGLVKRGTKGTKTDNNWNIEVLMKDLMSESFKQNPDALKELKDTNDSVLTHTQGDKVWQEAFPRLLMEIRDEKTAPISKDSNVETKTGVEFGSNSKIKDTVYHYAQSGTIDPTLKTNSKEKALFFFKNRKSAELLQEALNQGKPDKTGKIFEAKINLVNPREVDATDHDTGKLIEETIDADKSGNDGIIAHNMTEFFVGVDDQYGVFDIEKNVQFLNLEEKQTSTTKNNIKNMTKTLNYKDIEELLETYGNVRETVIGDEVGYVEEHDTKFKMNYRQKIRTMDGEVWDAIGLDGRDIAVLKNAITQLNKYRVHSQLTKPQQRVLKVMTDLTHEQLAEIIENSEYAAGASLGYNPNNYQETNDNRTVQMNAMQTREKIMVDNKYWKLYAKDKTYVRGKYDKYYGALGELINRIVKPNQVEVPGLLLKAISDGNFGMAAAAEYNYETHTIGISTKPTEAEMEQAVIDGLASKYVLDNNIASDQVMKNFGNIAKYVSKHQAKMLQNVMQSVASVKGPHAVTHELIHAGALNYMRANPEAEATLRINELYQEALANKDKIQRLAYSGDVFSTYWEKNVEEFLAEAMSNPGLMYALSQIKTDGRKKLSKGMLRELVDTLLDMLGLNPKVKDNVLEYVMDGFAAIIEAQADKVPVGLEIDSETKAMLMAKLNELKEQKGTIHLKDRAKAEEAAVNKLIEEGC